MVKLNWECQYELMIKNQNKNGVSLEMILPQKAVNIHNAQTLVYK